MTKSLYSKIFHDKKDEPREHHKHKTLHHHIVSDKKSQKHLSLEKKYHDLHVAYRNAKTESEKRKISKKIKQYHYKVSESRKKLHSTGKHHQLLHKLHQTKSDNDLHKEIHTDKSTHEIVDNTTEVEHTKLIKHVVPPIKSHVLQDIGRGIKSVLVGGGQLVGAGLARGGSKLSELANKLSKSTQQQETNWNDLGIDKAGG